MRAVVQRVERASVDVDGDTVGSIERGLLVLVGITASDGPTECEWLAEKIVGLRIFHDDEGRMNRSVREVGGRILLVSQFTLYGDARKGRRPSFVRAAAGSEAQAVYEHTVHAVERLGVPCQTGVFGAAMQVALVNDGPVTILLDSDKTF